MRPVWRLDLHLSLSNFTVIKMFFSFFMNLKKSMMWILVCAALLFFAPVIPVFSDAAVVAQDNSSASSNRKTKRTPVLRERVYKKIGEAQEHMDANRMPEALKVLEGLLGEQGLSSYERAMAWNFTAYIYATQEKYPQALAAYQNVIKEEEIPEGLELNAMYSVAQLYLIQDEFAKAVDVLKKWFALAENPGSSAYELMAQAYYQMEDYKNAIKYAEDAVALVKKQNGKPKEQLYLVLRAAYYELKNLSKVTDVLEELVTLYPKGDYFSQLSAMYGERDKEKEQLATLEAAYDAGLLSKERDLVSLASLLLQNDVPYKAANILEKGMKEKTIAGDLQNLKLLAQAWHIAQEPKKSIEVLTEAAKKSDEGDLYARLANAYIDLENWKMAEISAREAVKKGSLKRPGYVHVTIGMSLFNLNDYDGAIDAFKNAKKFDDTQKYAEQWIDFLTKEKERQQRIDNSLL